MSSTKLVAAILTAIFALGITIYIIDRTDSSRKQADIVEVYEYVERMLASDSVRAVLSHAGDTSNARNFDIQAVLERISDGNELIEKSQIRVKANDKDRYQDLSDEHNWQTYVRYLEDRDRIAIGQLVKGEVSPVVINVEHNIDERFIHIYNQVSEEGGGVFVISEYMRY